MALSLAAAPLRAADTGQVWLTASATKAFGARTSLQFEATQRWRPDSAAGNQRPVRLLIDRKIGGGFRLGGGIAGFDTDRGPFELRLHQQLSLSRGIFRARTRLEQRFIDDAARAGWRMRQRVGVDIPLDDRAWSVNTHSELFLTLRDADRGGPTGLTQMRATIAVERQLGKVTVSAGYLYQHMIVPDGRDRIAWIPQLGVGFSL